MASVTGMRFPDLCRKASCRRLKRPREPGRASDIDRSSPKILCHLSSETRRWLGLKSARMSARRSSRRCGREMVIAAVSRIHPRIFLQVDQQASPCLSFLTEDGSWRLERSESERGRKTSSIAVRRMRRTRRRRSGFPWARPHKSST